MRFEEVLKYIETAPHEELLKIRNLSTRLAYPNKVKQGDVIKFEPGKHWTESGRLADLLWFAVKENYPFSKFPDLSVWASSIEKLHRIDGFDYKLIQAVIVWASKDDFWKQNVRSGDALRRHFEKILVKIQGERQKKGHVHVI